MLPTDQKFRSETEASDWLTSGFLKDATEKDLKFKSFNFGWEITGNFDAAMKIRNLSGEYR